MRSKKDDLTNLAHACTAMIFATHHSSLLALLQRGVNCHPPPLPHHAAAGRARRCAAGARAARRLHGQQVRLVHLVAEVGGAEEQLHQRRVPSLGRLQAAQRSGGARPRLRGRGRPDVAEPPRLVLAKDGRGRHPRGQGQEVRGHGGCAAEECRGPLAVTGRAPSAAGVPVASEVVPRRATLAQTAVHLYCTVGWLER